MTRVTRGGGSKTLASGLAVPPVNVGIRSTPNYAHFTAQATHALPGGRVVFAGQRADGFFVDLGSIFDLGALRPFQNLHLIPSAAAAGVNGLQGLNVHTIAIQVPKTDLTRDGKNPTDVMDAKSVIGVYASASRQKTKVWDDSRSRMGGHGPWQQVSRLGNPLFNEVIVPMSRKDKWNALDPWNDSAFAQYVSKPELAGLLPVLYPGVFPNLKAYTKPRADLLAILLTGIPAGVVPGFQNFTGTHAGGPAPAQPRGAADGVSEPAGAGGRGRGRLPERPTGGRRRRHHRAPGGRRPDHPPGRPDLHPGRRDLGHQGRDDEHQLAAPQHLPLPRDAGWWLPGQARYVTGGLSPRAAADRTSPPPPVPSTSSP